MRTIFLCLAFGVVPLACCPTCLCSAAQNSPQVIAPNGILASSRTASGNSLMPQFSADGRFLVFLSHAPNLVTNDDLAPYLDVFVRNLESGQTILVSVNTNGIGGGNGDAGYPSISANGQFVAFASAANNLASGDTNNGADIFLRDLVAGTTRLVSAGVSGKGIPPLPSVRGPASNPQLSADGRWVLFESGEPTRPSAGVATNQVYLYDVSSGQTTLVSNDRWYGSNTAEPGDGRSRQASMTPDGHFVLFASAASRLLENDSGTAS